MKFTLSWLREHLETDAGLDDILTVLTRIGLEVESVEDRAKELAAFRVGFALESWDAARTHFNGQGYSDDELISAVEAAANETQSEWDPSDSAAVWFVDTMIYVCQLQLPALKQDDLQ